MSVRELLIALAASGCDYAWGLSQQTSHDAAVDAVRDAAAFRCVSTAPSDDFLIGPPCAGIGAAISGTAESLASGELVIALPAGVITYAGCFGQTTQRFLPGGVFAHVPQIATGPDEYNALFVHWADGDTTSNLGASPTGLSFGRTRTSTNESFAFGTAPLAPWWRMRPREDGAAIIAEWSQDGVAWQMFAVDPIAPPAMMSMEIAIGAFRADTQPSVARVASVDLCP